MAASILTPRWSLRMPTADEVAAFRAGSGAGAGAHASAGEPAFSYKDVGQTRGREPAPAGYADDHNRVRVGHGEAAFAVACAALRNWRMFPGPWTRIQPVDAPIHVGTVVTMQAHALGLWWLNACRIVYVFDETEPVRRFGFAYGTLPAHVEEGEERFSVELHADGSVWYDVRAFSRPRYWPVRLAQPLARRLQKRFVRESQATMQAIAAAAGQESARR